MRLRVYKYGTGDLVPDGAVYLCTKTETTTEYDYHENGQGLAYKTTKNTLVWHYFLVATDEQGKTA